jgi:diguanylate cyclase (GGDEF)-like protein/PAS domain S-box-containing protein
MKYLAESIINYFSLNTAKPRSEMSKLGIGKIPSSDKSILASQQRGISLDELHSLETEKRTVFMESFFEILTNIVAGCIDQNGKIMYLSPSVEDIFGYKASERVGFSVFDYVDLKTLPNFRRLLEDLIKVPGSSNSMEIMIKSKSGSIHSCEFSAKNCLDDPILKGIVFTSRDTTEQEMSHQEIKKMALYDPITGLPNQRYFEKSLNNEIDYAKESNTNLAIVQLGLDGFRFVNGALGHPTGNQLLRDLSNRMENTFNENVILHKMGGDIFTILMKNIIEYDDIHKTLNKLISLINKEPFKIGEDEVHITVSMGVSIFPYSGENVDILLKNAEIAMYHAKKSGKNQYQIFSSTMSLYSYKQFLLRNDSKKALLRNEFDVYYQPRINPITNEMESAEALIRWNHPKWGMVLPDEFISMAEDSGLIIPLGEWIIREVCFRLKKWEKENLPIKKISINLSSIQLLQFNFVDMVSTILKEFSVNPKWIEFEITETVIIEKEEQILTTLTALKNLGITIALDDFGTGYSSLNYLRKLPCEIIKIDKSLIRDIHKDQDNFEIVSSIITLCHKLKKSVVAEGVENEEQLSLLRKLRCNQIQGYLYSKPVAENEYKRFLKEGIETKVEKAVTIPKINRREYFRVQLEIPLLADMTIKEFENKKVNIGSIEVFIENIGPGGLCFHSPLKLPVSNDIILLFITEIFSIEWRIKGKIIWQKEIEDNYNRYGMKFILDDLDQIDLIKVLYNLQVKLRQNPILPDCRFYKK